MFVLFFVKIWLIFCLKSFVEADDDCVLLSNHRLIYGLNSNQTIWSGNSSQKFNAIKVRDGCYATLVYSTTNHEMFDKSFRFASAKRVPESFSCNCELKIASLLNGRYLLSSTHFGSATKIGRVRFAYRSLDGDHNESFIKIGRIKFLIGDNGIKIDDNNRDRFRVEMLNANQPKDLLHFNRSESYLWFSVDATRIVFGSSYMINSRTAIVSFAFNEKINAWIESFEIDKKIALINEPSIYESPLLDISIGPKVSAKSFLTLNRQEISPSVLPIEAQEQFHAINGITLSSEQIDAINFSLENAECLLNATIKGGNRNSVRVTYEQANLAAWLEIWPKGHSSSHIRDWIDSIGITRILAGSLVYEFYDPLVNASCVEPRQIETIELLKHEMSWTTPGYFQTHQIHNRNKTSAAISLQTYSKILSTNDQPKYNYLNNCNIQQETWKSDFLFSDLIKIVVDEFKQKKCTRRIKRECSLVNEPKCGSLLKSLNEFGSIDLDPNRIYQCKRNKLEEVDDCAQQACNRRVNKCEQNVEPKARALIQGVSSYSNLISGIIDLSEPSSNIVMLNGKIFGLDPTLNYKLLIHQSNFSSVNCINAGPILSDQEIALNNADFGVRRVKIALDRLTLKPVAESSLAMRSLVLYEMKNAKQRRPVACGVIFPLKSHLLVHKMFENGFSRADDSMSQSFVINLKNQPKVKQIFFYNNSKSINGLKVVYENSSYDLSFGSADKSLGQSLAIGDDLKILSAQIGSTFSVKSIKLDFSSNQKKFQSVTFGSVNALNSNRFQLIDKTGFEVVGFFGSFGSDLESFGLLVSEDAKYEEDTFRSAALMASAKIYGTRIEGTVSFYQASSYEPMNVTVELDGLKPNSTHGFHVHAQGVQVDQFSAPAVCNEAGGHLNPLNLLHGQIGAGQRHVGDYGNVRADSKGRVRFSFVDPLSELVGPFTVVGKTIVLHEKEDDLGLNGDDDGSQKTGNAGGRIACGLIISQPIKS